MQKLIIPLVFGLVLFGAAFFAVGAPDLASAQIWVNGQLPTAAASIALVQVMVWVVVAGGIVWSTALVGGHAISVADLQRRKKLWALLVMTVGLVIFAAGTTHHFGGATVSMYGGTLGAAQDALTLIR
jgi:hypothetical protein